MSLDREPKQIVTNFIVEQTLGRESAFTASMKALKSETHHIN